ncbi:twin-arginine translocase subunit TatC [Chitinophaga sancti]|uniref:Sec-independent protein translocase protein TatC n=1 Tax=Chitinophaga sancti TaxID=1004 RepID=A0A1K1RIT8_9BACT|nr:twin-arginine translocase subunit TatC [Chitinophaga sancti]WQD60693.1 twin-arginine translocase subunit TatC [Chitinophaga sancti]WQG87179.1 twin-arginine translocase subunit TatC [Chitinophaga sancti]SFW71992.1 sec-independent protein translocase protein TatC [Chitinophaga sancti]
MFKRIFANNNEKAEMTFFDHLEELRGHLFRAAVAIVVFGIIGWVYTNEILDKIVFGPTNRDFPSYIALCKISHATGLGDKLCIVPVDIVFQNHVLTGQIMLQFKLAFMVGLVLGFPYIFWEFWRFVKPALKEREVRGARGIIFWVSFQFFLGICFSYFLMAPFTINFLAGYTVTTKAVNQFFIDDYFDLMTQIVIGMGVLFELPVLIFFLTKIGLITPTFLRTYRRHAIVIILVLAAVITPPDVIDQLIVFTPLYLLYEISIYISVRALKNMEDKEKEPEIEEWS